MTVEFRIMGVPQRREKYILPMLEQLKLAEDIVSYDFLLEKNPMKSAKRAWLKKTTADHICVLQDDILLCDNFKEIVEKCANNFPSSVFSFYNPRLSEDDFSAITPYRKVTGCGMYGPAIMMPAKMVPLVFYWGDKVYGQDFKHDDTVIGFFCSVNGIDVMTTVPAIIQHLGHSESMLGYNNKRKISKVFCKEPDVNFFDTKQFIRTKNIPNTVIVPKEGYKTGKLVPLLEVMQK